MKSQISDVSERNKKSNLFIMCKPKEKKQNQTNLNEVE